MSLECVIKYKNKIKIVKFIDLKIITKINITNTHALHVNIKSK